MLGATISEAVGAVLVGALVLADGAYAPLVGILAQDGGDLRDIELRRCPATAPASAGSRFG
jgi:hypothetical protein